MCTQKPRQEKSFLILEPCVEKTNLIFKTQCLVRFYTHVKTTLLKMKDMAFPYCILSSQTLAGKLHPMHLKMQVLTTVKLTQLLSAMFMVNLHQVLRLTPYPINYFLHHSKKTGFESNLVKLSVITNNISFFSHQCNDFILTG